MKFSCSVSEGPRFRLKDLGFRLTEGGVRAGFRIKSLREEGGVGLGGKYHTAPPPYFFST